MMIIVRSFLRPQKRSEVMLIIIVFKRKEKRTNVVFRSMTRHLVVYCSASAMYTTGSIIMDYNIYENV